MFVGPHYYLKFLRVYKLLNILFANEYVWLKYATHLKQPIKRYDRSKKTGEIFNQWQYGISHPVN